jgi:hypothetical protein
MHRLLMICAMASFATAAAAQPHQLSNKQMDGVTAGFVAYNGCYPIGCGIDPASLERIMPPAPQPLSPLLPGATLSEDGIISLRVPSLFAAISPPIRN